jgi:potassium channel subfamily K, other eukaryote
MKTHYAPVRPEQTYSQGFWYAVIAAVLYLLCSMTLMINMLGFFLGKYPDTFDLTNSQRQLILQTMFFFTWLALGAEFFSEIETNTGLTDWTYVDGVCIILRSRSSSIRSRAYVYVRR